MNFDGINEDLKCLWMSSNLTEFKLCDKDFDCDNCEFDKEIKKSKFLYYSGYNTKLIDEKNVLERTIQRLNYQKNYFSNAYLYYSNNIILKRFVGETYYCGFNHMVNILLDNVRNAYVINNKTSFSKGEKFYKIEGDWGSVDITAPFDFHFVSDTLPLFNEYKYNKWLGFIEAKPEIVSKKAISSTDYLNYIDVISDLLSKNLKMTSAIGLTMFDGGEKVEYLFQIIGKENYKKIIDLLFS